MKFISTRGQSPPHSLQETIMAGLAPDGGLFLPATYPDASTSLASWLTLPFTELFQQVLAGFVEGDIPPEDLRELITRSFAGFDHEEITPVVPVAGCHMLELFHGPTFAFKDVALQFLGNVFEYYLARGGQRLTIAGATSGDTGSAAIHALRGKKGVEVFILFPKGRVSPIQERQMTTVPDANIHCIAVEGSFDDAQQILKGLFNDREFNDTYGLGAVNSINWMRVMAQVVYYFYAYFRVVQNGACALGEPVRFAVPTGNFGNIFAGYVAQRMGLPVDKLILATNANDILHRFVSQGVYRKGQVLETLSPSMDIQVASNFERYLFELCGRDAGQLQAWMEALARDGEFAVDAAQLAQVQAGFVSARVDDAATLETIREVHSREGYLLDPHSAVGLRGALDYMEGGGPPVICMGAAHPAKFGDAIEQATGKTPPMPAAMAQLAEMPTRLQVLPARLEAVQDYMRQVLAVPTQTPR